MPPGLPDSLGMDYGVPDEKNGSEMTLELPRPHPDRADQREGLSREEGHKFANANREVDGPPPGNIFYIQSNTISRLQMRYIRQN